MVYCRCLGSLEVGARTVEHGAWGWSMGYATGAGLDHLHTRSHDGGQSGQGAGKNKVRLTPKKELTTVRVRREGDAGIMEREKRGEKGDIETEGSF